MFTVKATYGGELRKFTFESSFFPTFDQLLTQLHRVFTSGSTYYLAKLLFSPNDSQPNRRILIGREVHNAEDYARCLLPYKGQAWPNGLLRFDLIEERLGPTDTAQSIMYNSSGSKVHLPAPTTPSPMSSFFVPPPPIVFSSRRGGDSSTTDREAHSFIPKPCPSTSGASECCSLAESKVEIQGLIHSFQDDLDRMLNRTFGRSSVQSEPPSPAHSSFMGTTASVNNPFFPSPPPIASCSLCARTLMGRWYTCKDCRARVCLECNLANRLNFCAVSLGSHQLDLTSPYLPTASPAWFQPPSWGASLPPFPLPSNTLLQSMGSPPVVPFIPPLRDVTSEGTINQPAQPSILTPVATPVSANGPTSVDLPAPKPASEATIVNPPPPPPVIHQNVLCDVCHATIEGIRHKCLDCTDFDLCTPCISEGALDRHDARHKFLELHEPTRVVVHTMYRDDGHMSPVAHNATCDLCDSRIFGDRHKCTACPDFDTCTTCFSITGEQHPGHSFVKISNPDSYIQRSPTRSVFHYAQCDACHKHIHGSRYKCMHPMCPDFDLCEACEALPIAQHPENHPMLKIRSNETIIPAVYRLGQNPPSNLQSSSQAPSLHEDASSIHSSTVKEASKSPASQVLTVSAPATAAPSLPDANKETSPTITSTVIKDGRPMSPVTSTTTAAQSAITSPFLPTSRSITSEASAICDMANMEASSTSSPVSAANGGEENMPVAAPTDKTPWATDVFQALNNLLPAIAPSVESGSSTQLLDEIDMPLSGLPEQCRDPKSSTNLQEAGAHSLGIEITQSSTRSLTALLGAYTSVSNSVSPEKRSSVEDSRPSATLVQDMTVPDGQIFAPGVTFVKCWRLLNDGTCQWPEDTSVVFVAGTTLNNATTISRHVGSLRPGEWKDVQTTELKAPELPGKYTSYWSLRDDKLLLFGTSLWVEIEVFETGRADSVAEDRMTSSSIIVMPDIPTPSVGDEVNSMSAQNVDPAETTDDDTMSDTSSVSFPTSDDDLWADSRRHAEPSSPGMEYDMLYPSDEDMY